MVDTTTRIVYVCVQMCSVHACADMFVCVWVCICVMNVHICRHLHPMLLQEGAP